MADQNFTMTSGDTQDVTATITDDDDASVALAGMTIVSSRPETGRSQKFFSKASPTSPDFSG